MSWGRPYYTLTARERPTVGDTKFSAVTLDHMGWLRCDGRNVPVSQQYILFQVIGYSFGSNTSNDFNLPNMSGKIPGALGQAGTGSNYSGSNWRLGQSTGTEYHTLTVAEMPTHSHNDITYVSSTKIVDLGHVHDGTTSNAGSHAHTYSATNVNNNNNIVNVTGSAANSGADGAATTGGVGDHNHGFITNISTANIFDPQHAHRIPADGGSNRHNNMQPTTFIGNMFIYCGKTNYASFNFPYKPVTNLY